MKRPIKIVDGEEVIMWGFDNSTTPDESAFTVTPDGEIENNDADIIDPESETVLSASDENGDLVFASFRNGSVLFKGIGFSRSRYKVINRNGTDVFIVQREDIQRRMASLSWHIKNCITTGKILSESITDGCITSEHLCNYRSPATSKDIADGKTGEFYRV